MDDPRDPSLENVLELHRDIVVSSLYVMMPGTVLDYNATKQTATVQPSIKKRRLAEDGETWIAEPVPAIHGVPVEFCGPARGRITWPVAANDPCEIRWASSSLARWFAQGPGIVDPGEERQGDPTDAICFVGLHSPASPPTDAPTDAVVIHVSGGTLIQLGGSDATLPVTRTSDVQSALTGALTDGPTLDAIFTYGNTPPGPGKAVALAAVVVAVNNYFTAHPVQGSAVTRSD